MLIHHTITRLFMRRLRFLPLVAILALSASACLDDSPFVPNIADTTFDPSLGVDIAASTRTATGLYYRDITVGGGAEVAATGMVPVSTAYVLHLRNGTHVQSGDFSFTVGSNTAIIGYEEGIRGMRVGGVRQLIIPPDLAYGDQESGGIPGNSILVYRVTLVSIN